MQVLQEAGKLAALAGRDPVSPFLQAEVAPRGGAYSSPDAVDELLRDASKPGGNLESALASLVQQVCVPGEGRSWFGPPSNFRAHLDAAIRTAGITLRGDLHNPLLEASIRLGNDYTEAWWWLMRAHHATHHFGSAASNSFRAILGSSHSAVMSVLAHLGTKKDKHGRSVALCVQGQCKTCLRSDIASQGACPWAAHSEVAPMLHSPSVRFVTLRVCEGGSTCWPRDVVPRLGQLVHVIRAIPQPHQHTVGSVAEVLGSHIAVGLIDQRHALCIPHTTAAPPTTPPWHHGFPGWAGYLDPSDVEILIRAQETSIGKGVHGSSIGPAPRVIERHHPSPEGGSISGDDGGQGGEDINNVGGVNESHIAFLCSQGPAGLRGWIVRYVILLWM